MQIDNSLSQMTVSRTSLQRNTPSAVKDSPVAVPDTPHTHVGVTNTQTDDVTPATLETGEAAVDLGQDPGQTDTLTISGC